MDGTTRIKLAVDHNLPLVRAGLLATLAEQPDLQLQPTWRQRDGLGQLDTDTRVLVLDLATGLRLAPTLRQSGPRGCQLMLLTEQAGEWDIHQAVALGILGLHLLDSPLERVVAGVRLLARGNRSFSDTVAACMVDCLVQPVLTDREREVLRLIVDGD